MICHVISAGKFLEPELSCEDTTSQKDWVTNEVYFGSLGPGGLIVDLPVALGRRLMSRTCPVFSLLGRYLKPFEVAVGVNGRAYIKTADGEYLRAVLVGQILEKCSSHTLDELESICQDYERRLKL